MRSGQSKRVRDLGVLCVGGRSTNRTLRIQILHRQLDAMLLFRIRIDVILYEISQIDIQLFMRLYRRLPSGCLRIALCAAKLLNHSFFVLVNETSEGALRNHKNAVTSLLSSLTDGLVNTMLPVDLEINFGHNANVDVTTRQTGRNCKDTCLTAHQSHDTHTVLRRFSLHICSLYERYSLSNGSLKAK